MALNLKCDDVISDNAFSANIHISKLLHCCIGNEGMQQYRNSLYFSMNRNNFHGATKQEGPRPVSYNP